MDLRYFQRKCERGTHVCFCAYVASNGDAKLRKHGMKQIVPRNTYGKNEIPVQIVSFASSAGDRWINGQSSGKC